MSTQVTFRDGSLYLPATLAETFFRGISAVALLVEEGRLTVLPVHGAAAGGVLLKVMNLAGDRVVHAPDALTAAGLSQGRCEIAATWDAGRHGLVLDLTRDEGGQSK